MEPELQRLIVDPDEHDTLAAVADLFVANLNLHDPKLLRESYDQVIGSVPEHLKSFYTELVETDDKSR